MPLPPEHIFAAKIPYQAHGFPEGCPGVDPPSGLLIRAWVNILVTKISVAVTEILGNTCRPAKLLIWTHWHLLNFLCTLRWMPVSSIEGCFDRRSFRSIKVDSIEDKSQFNQSVLNFSLAVDKRTKNNQTLSLGFYLHLLFPWNPCFDRTDVWFRSKELSIETTFDRTDLIPSSMVLKIAPSSKIRLIAMWSSERNRRLSYVVLSSIYHIQRRIISCY